MRLIAFALAAFVAGGPAAAQNWQEYSYPAYSFTVAFPADPQIETTTYRLADESAVIDHAAKTLSQGGEVKINIPHRVYQVYGRQLSILGADGSRSMVALFDFNGRLYQIEGKALRGGNPLDMLRFQQSLVFIGGGSNRSAEAIRAIREGCRGGAANPAGLDDPRCARQ